MTAKKPTTTIHAIECRTARAALDTARESGCGDAILLGGKHYALYRAEAERLEAAGVAFAYLHEITLTDGSRRIVTVPVND
jgi:hypothetical protein